MILISAINCGILTLKEDSAPVPTWLPCQHHAVKLYIEPSDFPLLASNSLPFSLLRQPSRKINKNVILNSVIFKQLSHNKSKIKKLAMQLKSMENISCMVRGGGEKHLH
jgi:hypothetical protein